MANKYHRMTESKLPKREGLPTGYDGDPQLPEREGLPTGYDTLPKKKKTKK